MLTDGNLTDKNYIHVCSCAYKQTKHAHIHIMSPFTHCSFWYVVPVIWNMLPAHVFLYNSKTLSSAFKRHLKDIFNTCFYATWLTLPVPLKLLYIMLYKCDY